MLRKLCMITLPFFILTGCAEDKTNAIHLVPDGYRGNLIAIYNVKGYPPLKGEGDYQVIPYNDKGIYLTSTPDMNYGTVNDQYFYVDNSTGKRKKVSEHCVHLGSNGAVQYDGGREFPHNHLIITNNPKECSQDFEVYGPSKMDGDHINQVINEELKRAKMINR